MEVDMKQEAHDVTESMKEEEMRLREQQAKEDAEAAEKAKADVAADLKGGKAGIDKKYAKLEMLIGQSKVWFAPWNNISFNIHAQHLN
jgi:hypothetical protein